MASAIQIPRSRPRNPSAMYFALSERLQELYTTEDGKLCKPQQTTRFLGIDEFKLHNGYRYAPHIIDMETGHILWIAGGKKKHFNVKVVSEVRKDEPGVVCSKLTTLSGRKVTRIVTIRNFYGLNACSITTLRVLSHMQPAISLPGKWKALTTRSKPLADERMDIPTMKSLDK